MNTPSPLWQAEDVVRAVRGRCLHEQSWSANGVSFDSRTTAPGDLFIALKGPVHDGHDHVHKAFAAGASAAIVARQPTSVTPDMPLIFVDDTLEALQALGCAGRARSRAKIVAVTGSVGKTTAKEMLRQVLGAVGKTHANPGSFNNHWGLPLALATLPADAEFGVFEIGMNHAGELGILSQMARPDIALITTIEAVHLEYFASTEAIADAKAEIFQGMTERGVVILNRDNPHYGRLAAAAKNRGIKKILSFSQSGKADASLTDYALTAENSTVSARFGNTAVRYTIGSPGQHLVQNSLGVLLTAQAASGNLEECALALANYAQPKGRGGANDVALATGGKLRLIDESFNASPVSMRAALRVLAQTTPERNGRRIAVLGDMRELGPTSATLHQELAAELVTAKVDLVFCCGEMMRHLYDALPASMRGAHLPDSAALAPVVAQAVRADDIVTVKGSHSIALEIVIDAVKALGVNAPLKTAL